MSATYAHSVLCRRRGAAIVVFAFFLFVIVGMAAFAIDVGLIFLARAELQNAADSAAMAAAWELLDENRLQGIPEMTAEIAAARQQAVDYAALNPVMKDPPVVDPNTTNGLGGDVVVGYLNDPSNQSESLSLSNPTQFNSVQVRVRRDSVRNGPINLVFGAVLGRRNANVAAQATASFKDGTIGYKVTEKSGNAKVLPLALKEESWEGLLNWTFTTGDNYKYNLDTRQVTLGQDGIPELNLYPGAGAYQLPPGNLGTLDIGWHGNSTSEIARQIRYGVSADDLDYHGGELKLGYDGTLVLNGDSGLSGSIKDDLKAIKGKPRAIAVFTKVSGPGDNANYTVIGFAGIRILEVTLTGPMHKKRVVIQPSYVVDAAAITGPGSGPSYFVFQPVHLVR